MRQGTGFDVFFSTTENSIFRRQSWPMAKLAVTSTIRQKVRSRRVHSIMTVPARTRTGLHDLAAGLPSDSLAGAMSKGEGVPRRQNGSGRRKRGKYFD